MSRRTRLYWKKKNLRKILSQEKYEKMKYWENPEQKRACVKAKYMGNLLRKIKYDKSKYEENPEAKRKYIYKKKKIRGKP